MIKKLSKILILTMLIIIINIQVIKAVQSAESSYEIKATVEQFFKYMNDGDNKVFDYIDTSNTLLYNNIEDYLHSLSINYEITNITQQNDIYTVEAKISATGIGWNVNGFKINLNINNKYKIINTSLFNVIGTKNIFLFVLKIFAIIGGIFLTITVTIIIIVICVVRKRKKI